MAAVVFVAAAAPDCNAVLGVGEFQPGVCDEGAKQCDGNTPQTCDAGQCSYLIADFYEVPLDKNVQIMIFIAFLTAFAVKVPMWPVHTWLPDAHVEAPTGGSVILAAIMLKMGGYGFLRFSLPITPDAAETLDWLVISLSLIAVVYIGFVALVQQDMKKLIAYSSIAHMGFVTLGTFLAMGLARDFGYQTIAEGVENRETLDLLREIGVDFAQGFYLGRPAPIES